MDAEVQRIAEGLQRAIRFEGDGHHFYMMAAHGTSDEKGREVFEMLAREELEHVRFLHAQYEAFRATGAADPNAKLPAPAPLDADHPIFSSRIRERISEAHIEMSALSIGMQLELSSINFYKSEADASSISEVKKFYNELAQWEKGHYEALQREQDSLKNDYWDKGGFAPF